MVDLGLLGGLTIGGVLSKQAADETNRANQEQGRLDREATRANQERGLQALQLESPFGTRTQAPGGGFRVEMPGGPQATTARTLGADADVTRRLMQLENIGFSPTIKNLGEAQQWVSEDDQAKMELAQSGFEDIISARQRLGGQGQLPGSGFEGTTAKKIGDYAKTIGLGGNERAADLYRESLTGDIKNYTALQQALQPKVPAPSFSQDDSSAALASNLVAQTPPPEPPTDLSGALGYDAGANIIQNILNQQLAQQTRDDYLKVLQRFRPVMASASGGTIG